MAGKPENTGKKTSIGGQALIEGVMMRGAEGHRHGGAPCLG